MSQGEGSTCPECGSPTDPPPSSEDAQGGVLCAVCTDRRKAQSSKSWLALTEVTRASLHEYHTGEYGAGNRPPRPWTEGLAPMYMLRNGPPGYAVPPHYFGAIPPGAAYGFPPGAAALPGMWRTFYDSAMGENGPPLVGVPLISPPAFFIPPGAPFWRPADMGSVNPMEGMVNGAGEGEGGGADKQAREQTPTENVGEGMGGVGVAEMSNDKGKEHETVVGEEGEKGESEVVGGGGTGNGVARGDREPCFNCKTMYSPLWRRDTKGNCLCNACGLFFKSHGRHRPMKDNQGASRGGAGSAATVACVNCNTTTTTLWRRSQNNEVVCNACGLYYKLHGRMRPLTMRSAQIKKRNRKAKALPGVTMTPNVVNRRLEENERYPMPVNPGPIYPRGFGTPGEAEVYPKYSFHEAKAAIAKQQPHGGRRGKLIVQEKSDQEKLDGPALPMLAIAQKSQNDSEIANLEPTTMDHEVEQSLQAEEISVDSPVVDNLEGDRPVEDKAGEENSVVDHVTVDSTVGGAVVEGEKQVEGGKTVVEATTVHHDG